jgi:hypothetical protein
MLLNTTSNAIATTSMDVADKQSCEAIKQQVLQSLAGNQNIQIQTVCLDKYK